MGSRTRDAIAAYRRKANLAGDPVVDKPLLISLNTITHRAGSFTFTGKAAAQAPSGTGGKTDSGAGSTIEERLVRIRTLVEKGLITKEEAAAKRSEILEGL